MAIEDAAVLAGCLSRANSTDEIPELMRAYEEIRKPRAEKIKATSEGNMRQYGMEDGPEQVARDEMYKKTLVTPVESKEKKEVVKADMNATYGSPGFSMWLYGYDIDEQLRQYFQVGTEV
jgi:salicylate hydroxylase